LTSQPQTLPIAQCQLLFPDIAIHYLVFPNPSTFLEDSLQYLLRR
jgi:hypothetical protein